MNLLETKKQKQSLYKPRRIQIVEYVIFNSKYLLIPFYVILIACLFFLAFLNIREFIDYAHKFSVLTKEGSTLAFIEMVDLTMIAALGIMIITGGYNSFVSKNHNYSGEKIGSGLLKVKVATSLIGVTSIALLAKSINISIEGAKIPVSWEELYKLGFIHGLFLAGAIVLSIVDYLHIKTEIDIERLKKDKPNYKAGDLEDGK